MTGVLDVRGRVPPEIACQEILRDEDIGTRGGYGQVAEKETSLADVLARLLTTPDMWRTFTGSYLKALEAVGRGESRKPRTSYGSFDDTSHRREQRTDDLAAWHEMLLDRFAGTPEDELLDQLVASHGLGGPELTFLQAKLAERRGDRAPPPAEDIGGVWGLHEIVSLVAHPEEEVPEHWEDLVRHLRETGWDPAACDQAELNKTLAEFPAPEPASSRKRVAALTEDWVWPGYSAGRLSFA